MKQFIPGAAALIVCAGVALGQNRDPQNDTQNGKAPIYRVTVVQRSMKAINYEYRSGFTPIDFRGTVLLPHAKGYATVESKRGRTEISATFEHFTAPFAFGAEYLTYVLWAITPDGRPHNIGEIIPNGSDRATLHVTTDLQAFGMMVTAEPYSAVRQPSDVVVAENQIRDDTVGTIKEIEARYELLPRGHYTWQMPDKLKSDTVNTRKVSMGEYEALSELYQAQNAVAIAGVANAGQYAPETFAKAQRLLNQAQQLNGSKADHRTVVQSAREAAQTAEDARLIAERRQQEDKLAAAQAQISVQQRATVQAEADLQSARAEASAAQAQVEAERLARQRAEAELVAAREQSLQAQATARQTQQEANRIASAASADQRRQQEVEQKAESRRRLLGQLNGTFSVIDSPRGIVVTVADNEFAGTLLRPEVASRLARVAQTVASNSDLRIEVEGHTDAENTSTIASRRAEAVRNMLTGSGVPPNRISARGWGAARPLGPNGRENRRVEIVISGESIGARPLWDQSYSLSRR